MVLPCLECFENSQKLSIVDLLVDLSWDHLWKKKSYRILLAQIVGSQLAEDYINSIGGCLCLNLDIMLKIKIVKYSSLDERLFEFDKSFFGLGSHNPFWSDTEIFSLGVICFKNLLFLQYRSTFWTLLFINFYHFFVPIHFHLNHLLGFSYHIGLDFRLYNLLLRSFSTWIWVRQ